MTSPWLKSVVQWILVICCAEAVTVPVAAFQCVLTSSVALQVQDERETETVAVAGESRRRVETPCLRRGVRSHSIVADRLRTESPSASFDGRSELQTRFLSLRC